jgi:hypothetical protein
MIERGFAAAAASIHLNPDHQLVFAIETHARDLFATY